MKKDFHQSVRRAMDSCFSGVRPDPLLAQKIINCKEEKPVKKKLTFAAIFVLLLILLAAAALAIGIYDTVKPAMDQSATILQSEDWGLESKLQFAKVLHEYGVVPDDDAQLAVCMDSSAADDIREEAADILIDRICGELMRKDLDPTILQSEEYPSPDLETVFTVFYRSISPDADQAIISAEYEKWFSESDLFKPADESTADNQSEKATEEDILELCRLDLSEIYSFSKTERQSTEITVRFDDEAGLWIANFYVEAEDLRSALRAEWGADYYDAEQNAYHWQKLFLANGKRTDAANVEDYLFSQLIPDEGYPNYDQWDNGYRAFLYCSAEERAAFSETYKPIVDSFLAEHPNVKEYYETTQDFNTIYITTRHVYGVPDASSVSENQAIETAIAAWVASGEEGVWPEMLDSERSIYALYDITDPENPLWKVSLSYWYEKTPDPNANKDGYFVILNARTGEIVSQYIESGAKGASQYCGNALDFAETFL